MDRHQQLRTELLDGKTVVVHIGRDARFIDWAKERGLFVRIDRRTRWGNPFPIGQRWGNRDDVCQLFEEQTLPGLLPDIAELRGRALGCWCAPARCHGDALARAANETGDQEAGQSEESQREESR